MVASGLLMQWHDGDPCLMDGKLYDKKSAIFFLSPCERVRQPEASVFAVFDNVTSIWHSENLRGNWSWTCIRTSAMYVW